MRERNIMYWNDDINGVYHDLCTSPNHHLPMGVPFMSCTEGVYSLSGKEMICTRFLRWLVMSLDRNNGSELISLPLREGDTLLSTRWFLFFFLLEDATQCHSVQLMRYIWTTTYCVYSVHHLLFKFPGRRMEKKCCSPHEQDACPINSLSYERSCWPAITSHSIQLVGEQRHSNNAPRLPIYIKPARSVAWLQARCWVLHQAVLYYSRSYISWPGSEEIDVEAEGLWGRRPMAAVSEQLPGQGRVGVRTRPRHTGRARRGGKGTPGVHGAPLPEERVTRSPHAHAGIYTCARLVLSIFQIFHSVT